MKKIFLGLLLTLLSQSLQARYYDPDMGRFASRDPIEYSDGMNLYAGYFAQKFALDPMGTEIVFPKIDVDEVLKKVNANVDKYNKLNNEKKPHYTKDDIKNSDQIRSQIEKWIKDILAKKEGSKELQEFVQCLHDSNAKINFTIDFNLLMGTKNNKPYVAETPMYLTKGGADVLNTNEFEIPLNVGSKKFVSGFQDYFAIHELLHVVEWSIVTEKAYEEKYKEKMLDCKCIDILKQKYIKNRKVIPLLIHQPSLFKKHMSLGDYIQHDYFKMKSF